MPTQLQRSEISVRTERSIPDTCKDGKTKSKTPMEETITYGKGLREATSSELLVTGGGSGAFANLFEKIRNLIDTIADYLPNFLKGFKDGFLGKDRDD